MDTSVLRYSRVYEDEHLLRNALRLLPTDSVLSVSSAGDNVLGLLLAGPKEIVAVDMSPAQNALLELKLALLQRGSYQSMLNILGLTSSPLASKLAIYSRMRPYLSPASQVFWDNNSALFDFGVTRCGRLDRYIAGYRDTWLPHVLAAGILEELCSAPTLQAQCAVLDRILAGEGDIGNDSIGNAAISNGDTAGGQPLRAAAAAASSSSSAPELLRSALLQSSSGSESGEAAATAKVNPARKKGGVVTSRRMVTSWERSYRVYFGREMMARTGRHPAQFAHLTESDGDGDGDGEEGDGSDVGGLLWRRQLRALRTFRVQDNPYLELMFRAGPPSSPRLLPDYLQPASFPKLRALADRVTVVTATLEEYLQRPGCPVFSAANLSDVFEYMSEEETARFGAALRARMAPGARLAYWTLFLPRDPGVGDSPTTDNSDGGQQRTRRCDDRVYFYRQFCLQVVAPKTSPLA